MRKCCARRFPIRLLWAKSIGRTARSRSSRLPSTRWSTRRRGSSRKSDSRRLGPTTSRRSGTNSAASRSKASVLAPTARSFEILGRPDRSPSTPLVRREDRRQGGGHLAPSKFHLDCGQLRLWSEEKVVSAGPRSGRATNGASPPIFRSASRSFIADSGGLSGGPHVYRKPFLIRRVGMKVGVGQSTPTATWQGLAPGSHRLPPIVASSAGVPASGLPANLYQ